MDDFRCGAALPGLLTAIRLSGLGR